MSLISAISACEFLSNFWLYDQVRYKKEIIEMNIQVHHHCKTVMVNRKIF